MEIHRNLLSELRLDELEPLIKDSFFASPGFLNLWRVRGGVTVFWTVRMDNAVAAVLPGVEFGKGPLRRFYSTPNGCYGRLCFAQGLERKDRVEIASRLLGTLANAGYMKVFVSDFHGCFEPTEKFRSQQCETRLVDISEPNWQPPHRKLRQDISRAEREGVVLERFDGARHWAGFDELVRISQKRIGTARRYSPQFFRVLEELSRYDDRVRWVFCQHDGRPVVSSIFLIEGDNLLYWHVYFDESLSHLQATKYAIFITARELSEKGVRYLNLGGSPENVPNVHAFKEKWGGEICRYRCHYVKSLLGGMI